MAVAVETEEGHAWAMGRIKALTGGDRITARLMRRDFFDYDPVLKLWVMGNHRPKLRRLDYATRRRLHLIPFTVTIPEAERDRDLEAKLVAEWPGILRWGVDGGLDLQKQGLNPPEIVRDATARYFEAEDAFARWLDERTEKAAPDWTAITRLADDFRTWCGRTGETFWSQRDFVDELENRGFHYKRYNHGRGFLGIRLKLAPDNWQADGEE